MFVTPQDIISNIELIKMQIEMKERKLPVRFGPGGPANDEEELIHHELDDLRGRLEQYMTLAMDLPL